MADFTNVWDETVPLGTADADNIDEFFRALKFDIRERMNTLLDPAGQWDAGVDVPLKLLPVLRTGIVINLSAMEMAPNHFPDDVSLFNDGHFESSSSGSGYMSFRLQNNWNLKTLTILIDKNSAAALTIKLRKNNYNTGHSQTVLATISHSASGVTLVTVFDGTESVADQVYFLSIEISGSGVFKFFGAQLTVDEVN